MQCKRQGGRVVKACVGSNPILVIGFFFLFCFIASFSYFRCYLFPHFIDLFIMLCALVLVLG